MVKGALGLLENTKYSSSGRLELPRDGCHARAKPLKRKRKTSEPLTQLATQQSGGCTESQDDQATRGREAGNPHLSKGRCILLLQAAILAVVQASLARSPRTFWTVVYLNDGHMRPEIIEISVTSLMLGQDSKKLLGEI